MRFYVTENKNGKYVIVDSSNDKLCAYSGKATNPPAYKDESMCKEHEWNNYYSALGFSQRLEVA